MLRGAHVVVFSKDAEADRAFFRDVLCLPSVDAGHGWLIFALPPAEVAVHPTALGVGELALPASSAHELYLMCDDVHAFVDAMKEKGVACSPVHEERLGSITRLTLPGGGGVGVYQPKHPSPRY